MVRYDGSLLWPAAWLLNDGGVADVPPSDGSGGWRLYESLGFIQFQFVDYPQIQQPWIVAAGEEALYASGIPGVANTRIGSLVIVDASIRQLPFEEDPPPVTSFGFRHTGRLLTDGDPLGGSGGLEGTLCQVGTTTGQTIVTDDGVTVSVSAPESVAPVVQELSNGAVVILPGDGSLSVQELNSGAVVLYPDDVRVIDTRRTAIISRPPRWLRR
jgi:hypothetical protein